MSGVRVPLSQGEMLARAWLINDLCRPRGWSELPRDQPLWRLRCTAAEVARMRALLLTSLRAYAHPTPYVSALFCLYAAERLRRAYLGGTRSWDLVATGLDRHLTQAHLQALTEQGLKFWKRPLRSGGHARQFLHSLALEGGIPDSLLSGEARTITLFLRSLLAEVEAFGARDLADARRLAEQSATMLPSTWQEDDILEMAATLALEIARIRYKLRGQSFHQIAAWFAAHPDWASGMPVDVGSEQVLALIQGLVSLPKLRARLPRLERLCRRVLVKRGELWLSGFILESDGLVPPTLLQDDLFTDETVDRVRLTLETGPEAGKALAVIERVDGELRFLPLQDKVMLAPAAAEIRVRVICQGVERGALPLPGGRALPEAPWVLVDDDADASEAPRRLRFLGSGSTNTRHPRLFLAVDPATGSLGGTPSLTCGFVSEGRRVVHQLEARSVWQSALGDGDLRLVPHAERDECHPLGLLPRRPPWTVLAPYVSLGPPAQLGASIPGGPRLHWRRRPQDPWQRLTQWPEGTMTLAMLDGSVIWDMDEILILPAQAAIHTQRQGEQATLVTVTGLGPDVAVEETEVAQREAIPGGVRLRVVWPDLPRPTLTLRTKLGPHGQEVRHIIAVKLSAGAFYDDADRRLRQNAILRFDQLSQYRALSGGLEGERAELLVQVRGGQHWRQTPVAEVGQAIPFIDILPLHGIRRRLLRQFATHGQQDALARVQLLRNGITGAQFELAPFSHTLRVDGATGSCVCLPPTEVMSLSALSLTRPSASPEPLGRMENGTWLLPPLAPAETWLIVGAGASKGMVRAVNWGSGSAETATGLAGCVGIVEHAARQEAIIQRLDVIATDPNTAGTRLDLQYLSDLRGATRRLDIPALALDILRRLANHPACLWLLLLEQDGSALQDVIELEDELPFLWCLMPPAPLLRLMAMRMAELRRLRLPEELVRDVIGTKLNALTTACPQLKAACWVAREKFGLSHAPGELSLEQLCRPEVVQMLKQGLVRPVLTPEGWATEIARARNWMNLPIGVHELAPILAGAHLAQCITLPPDHVRAIRHCRDRDEEAFDRVFREAFQLTIALARKLPLENYGL